MRKNNKFKGALFIEYALILAFVVIGGFMFVSENGTGNSILGIFATADETLQKAASGDSEPSQQTREQKIANALKKFNLDDYKASTKDNKGKNIIGSYASKDTDPDSKDKAVVLKGIIDQMDLGDVLGSDYSWRYVGTENEGYLYLSPTTWGNKAGVDKSIIMHIDSNYNTTYSVAKVYHSDKGQVYIGTGEDVYGQMGQASTKNGGGAYAIKNADGTYSYTGRFKQEGTTFSSIDEAIKAYKS